jgi:polar amino acid transport system permease protein
MSSATVREDLGRSAKPAPARGDYSHYRIVPARHPWRIAGTVIAVIILGSIVQSVLTNPRWGWGIFRQWFFSEPVLEGLAKTLLLTALGTVIGFLLGAVIALGRIARSPLLAALAWGYVWFFRSIPILVLLLVVNNLGYLYDNITVGIPLTGLTFFSYPTTQFISPFVATLIGLSLNQAAFSSEIIRGGILSVDVGQIEAAAALGLSRSRQIFRIILPQAMRSILPGAFNDVISLAKNTANAYILALPELFYTVMVIYRRNLEVIPLLMVATVWYIVIQTTLSGVQHVIELRFSRGALRTLPRSFWSRIRGRPEFLPSNVASASAPINTPAGWAESHTSGAEVTIHRVSKRFGALKVLDDISLDIPAGSVTAILGRSGSGKSTLLRCINHLERVDDGFIAIDGELVGYRLRDDTLYELGEREILERRADVAMVFQSFNLFPHLTVRQNVMEAPMGVRGLSRDEAGTLADELLSRVGLRDKAAAYPRQLSGGQQQRVAIARALALRPKVLLFDEPTSALDPELVGEVLDVIKELSRSGTTLIVVTHEVGFAREVAHTIVFMDHGHVLDVGSPEKIFNASNPRVSEFLAKVL